jgi:hypothetical protein
VLYSNTVDVWMSDVGVFIGSRDGSGSIFTLFRVKSVKSNYSPCYNNTPQH